MEQISIHIVGKAHTKKSTIAVAIGRMLANHGVAVISPPDRRLDYKTNMTDEEIAQALRDCGVEVLLVECDTPNIDQQ